MNAILADQATPGRRPWHFTWTPVFVGFLAYAFIIMTYRVPIATVVMAAALLSLLLQREALRAPSFVWLFAAWIMWAGVGYAVTRYPDVVWPSLIEQGKVLLVALVAVNALRSETQIRYFMLFLLVSYVLFPARSTLVNYFVTGNTLLGRAIGPFIYSNPNDLAALTILMLGPALALWASAAQGSVVRWAALAGAAPLIVIIILTQSRGAFIALVVMALPSAIALVRRRPRTVALLAAVVGLALYLAPTAFWKRMEGLRNATSVETIGEMDPEGSARQRFAVLQNAVHIVQDHPILGIGLGAYGLANAQYNPSLGTLDTHNTYLNIAAETGLPGLVLFLMLVASVLRRAHEARRRAQRVLPAQAEMLRWLQYGLIGYLTAGVFGSYSRLTFPYVFLGLLWSASQAVRAQCPPVSAAPAPLRGPPSAPWINGRRRWGV
jgi:putative inorganic carbon (hco3(-)) transporter